ncbi:hypothetical protein [Novosphingobium sp. TCA1]|uniref:hypothetical protein n=1 Tax=Novosphingobium sp. TCA1 TaxID=2682474 RepID=UPI00130B6493|nr:hypothetical protein [Novosphingobium sp. TCA1]GFE77464.1 hypothetical protein NTCA1_51130 [Novosphingobium sp. TCA1]
MAQQLDRRRSTAQPANTRRSVSRARRLPATSPSESQVTAHHITEMERLIRAETYRDVILTNPALVASAKQQIAHLIHNGEATLGQRLWHALLDQPHSFILACMTADDAEGRLLRSNNPFSTLIGERDTNERVKTWRMAKARLSPKQT